MIPKILHYCWFGDNPFCGLSRKCMDSWGKNCPDYKVMHWDESSIDLNEPMIARFVRRKQWAFLSDYVRLQKLFEHGGIYLDTDMEIVKPLDPLLELSCFIGEESDGRVNNGILGAEAGHPYLQSCIDLMVERDRESKPFLISPEISTRALPEHRESVTVFPPEYFYPYNPYNDIPDNAQLMYSDITENTFAIHHWAKRWSMPFHQKVIRTLDKLIAHRAPGV